MNYKYGETEQKSFDDYFPFKKQNIDEHTRVGSLSKQIRVILRRDE
jgi:hypothetical protein